MTEETKDKVKKDGVGSTATAAILAHKTNEEVLAEVQKAHPESKTSLASINWYRNKIRSENPSAGVKTSRELRAAAKPKDPLA